MPKYYIEKGEFKIVTTDEITPYIEGAKSGDMQVLVALAFLTGARISELLSLRKKDIIVDREKNEFRLRLISLKTYSSKKYASARMTGEKLIPPTREIVFDTENDPFIKSVVLPYIEGLGEEARLFEKSRRWYQYRLNELNRDIHGEDESKYITFHYLRHSVITFITRELRANPSDIKGWTGHRGSSYEVYLIPSPVDRFKGQMGKR